MLTQLWHFFQHKKLRFCISTYKKHIELDPDYSIAYNNIGAVYNEMNGMNSAVYFYKKALISTLSSECLFQHGYNFFKS